MARRLVILDRDGVINHDSREFVKSADQWLPIDGSIEGIAILCRAGFTVAVATNQSGIGRGLFDEDALDAMHAKLRDLVADAGGEVGSIVYCPHLPDDGCDCRKPAPGLYEALGDEYGLPLTGVPIVGDSKRDLDAAVAVGGRPILVLTGNGRETGASVGEVETYPDLLAAATQLAAELGRGAH